MQRRKRDPYTGDLFAPRCAAATAPAPTVDTRAVAEDVMNARQRSLTNQVRINRICRTRWKTWDTFIANLRPGSIVIERFRIDNGTTVAKPHRRPYARFTVGDRTGSLALYHWCPLGREQAEALVAKFRVGTIAIVDATYESGDGRWQPRLTVNPSIDQSLIVCPEGHYDPLEYR